MAKCTCTFAQRMVGDGCEVCNPTHALEMAREQLVELEVEVKWLRDEAVYARTFLQGKLESQRELGLPPNHELEGVVAHIDDALKRSET